MSDLIGDSGTPTDEMTLWSKAPNPANAGIFAPPRGVTGPNYLNCEPAEAEAAPSTHPHTHGMSLPTNGISTHTHRAREAAYLSGALLWNFYNDGYKPHSEIHAFQWRDACIRIMDIYNKQSRKVYALLENTVRAGRGSNEEERIEAGAQLTLAFELIGEPALFATAAFIHNDVDDATDFKVVARSLSEISDTQTAALRVHVLGRSLKSESPQIRYLAVKAVGEIGGGAAQEILEEVAQADTNADVKRIAASYRT